MDRKNYRKLNLMRLGERCKKLRQPWELRQAIAPMLRQQCPHFGVVYDEAGYHLVYAETAHGMNLERMIENMNLLRDYADGKLQVEDCGLSSEQILLLIYYGYGIVASLDTFTNLVEICLLRKEFDSALSNVPKKRQLYVHSKRQGVIKRVILCKILICKGASVYLGG